MRTLALVVSLASLSAAAQGWEKRATEYRQKLDAERKKLGLDKKGQTFPTPEVKFVGTAAGDGLLGVLCPGEALVVTLDGVPPKSLVTANRDDVELSKETWAGNKWTGTLTAKKGAAPGAFSLVAVYATSGREAWSSSYLLGCKRTLTVVVDDMTLTLPLDLRGLRQRATGEWKKAGKVTGSRTYDVGVSEGALRLTAEQTDADMQRLSQAMTTAMQSPKAQALDKRFEAAMKKLDACSKTPATMGPCMEKVQPEIQQITTEREAINADLERASAPPFGCNTLDVSRLDDESDAEGCAGHRNPERVKLKATWN